MPQCEMCGTEAKLVDAIVEGSILSVCSRCAKFGNVIAIQKPVENPRPSKKLEIKQEIEMDKEVETIVEDYSLLVRKARERKGLKQEELARFIAEKESVIQKVESGHLEPSFSLAKKLEQFLGIKLIDKTNVAYEKKELDLNDSTLTIGDLIKFKKN